MAAACVAEDGPVSVSATSRSTRCGLAGEPAGDGQRRVDLHVVLGVPQAPEQVLGRDVIGDAEVAQRPHGR